MFATLKILYQKMLQRCYNVTMSEFLNTSRASEYTNIIEDTLPIDFPELDYSLVDGQLVFEGMELHELDNLQQDNLKQIGGRAVQLTIQDIN